MADGTFEDALALVVERFRGVVDKAGKPYVLHLLRVALALEDRDAQIAGLLHDVVEDTDVELEDLKKLGFSQRVIEAVDCLTHASNIGYGDYVCRLKKNPIARLCKLADLTDNYRIDRVAFREPDVDEDAQRIGRYILSYKFLDDEIDEPTYLRRMKAFEA